MDAGSGLEAGGHTGRAAPSDRHRRFEDGERLSRLGYTNVSARQGDGYAGWPEQAPFDVILVTAAPESVPEPLVAQLKPGGRMVIPVGPVSDVQDLILIEKDASGHATSKSVIPVRFVPMIRRQAIGGRR